MNTDFAGNAPAERRGHLRVLGFLAGFIGGVYAALKLAPLLALMTGVVGGFVLSKIAPLSVHEIIKSSDGETAFTVLGILGALAVLTFLADRISRSGSARDYPPFFWGAIFGMTGIIGGVVVSWMHRSRNRSRKPQFEGAGPSAEPTP